MALRVLSLCVLTLSVATAQVYQLTTETFDVALQEGPLFVKFYAPWCARPRRRRNSGFSRQKPHSQFCTGAPQF